MLPDGVVVVHSHGDLPVEVPDGEEAGAAVEVQDHDHVDQVVEHEGIVPFRQALLHSYKRADISMVTMCYTSVVLGYDR